MLSLTENFKGILPSARAEANKYHHKCIASGHLFAGLLQLPETSGAIRVLVNLGFEIDKVKTELEMHLGQIPEDGPLSVETIPYTAAAKRLFASSSRQARKLHANAMTSEHMLLALVLEKEGVLQLVFERLGLEAQQVEIAILELPHIVENA